MSKFTKFQVLLVTFLIAIATFYAGYYLGKRGFVYEVRKNPPEIKISNQFPPDQEIDFSLFWEVWSRVQNSYLERPVDGKAMLYGAISGMVDAVGDPYTSYLPPEVNKAITDSINGTYQGIGAELALKDEQLIVVAPLDGSPAKDAGVRAGDKIYEIDGQSTIGMNVSEAVAKIRGDSGTIVALTLGREGTDEPIIARIKRGTITIDSVTWEDKGNGTAYIRVGRFGGETNDEWKNVVSEVNSQMAELDAVIVDVRGNPGGYLQSAVYLAEEFMRDVPVLYQESATGEQEALEAKRVGAFDSVPEVIVLVDGGSASASEILAAALRDNIGATLVGTQTFGKGTIQDAEDFEDGSGVHITVAKWLTPNKVWVHGVGLTPDTIVEVTEEELNSDVDKQLEVALELANQI